MLCDIPRDAWGRRRSPITLPEYRLGVEPPNKGKTYPIEVLTTVEMHRLIAGCSRRSPSGIRNRAMIVAMWRSGLRVAEVLALEPRDLDLDERTIRVRHGKGNKARTVSIDAEACAVIETWLAERRRIGIGRTIPQSYASQEGASAAKRALRGEPTRLFCTISKPMRGGPVCTSYARELVKELAERAEIAKHVHPHGLRHTLAYDMCREGVPLPLIQAQLGHNSLATTARYVSHFAPTELIRVMGQRPSWGEKAA